MSYPHDGPASFLQSSVMRGWAGKAKMLIIFMTLYIKQLLKYRKMDDSQRFAYICFWSTSFFKIQHYRIYKPNQTKHRTSEENSPACGTGLSRLVAAVDLSPKPLAKLCGGVAILTPGSTLKSPGLGHSS